MLANYLEQTEYTISDLTAGLNYQFKVEARNSYGFSAYSDTLQLLCAFKPEAPLTVTTTNLNDKVVVDWAEPVSNGSPITAYKVYIANEAGNEFSQESADCDGTSAAVIAARQCEV